MLEITYQKVTDLIPYVNNSRTHSEEQVKQIAASIKEFGFTNPILIDENKGVIAGHGRLLAAGKIALAEVPTIVLEGLTEAQRKAYVIADNQIALNSGWDIDTLRVEIERLSELDFDLDLIGFDADVLDKLVDIDADLPELPDGDRNPFQQKTFTLHDEQAGLVDDAILLARSSPLVDTGINENSNGNALALICQQWLENNGKS
jgi:ParB family transcriptional regulator, chromosome partitioning protein